MSFSKANLKSFRTSLVIFSMTVVGDGMYAAEAQDIPKKVEAVQDTWIGRVEFSAGEVRFVVGDQRYEIEGPLEKYLIPFVGKERMLTGRLVEGRAIEVIKMQPPPTSRTKK